MRISSEKLSAEAQRTGFRPDMLEKVAHLLTLLNALQSHPFLKERVVLKGGTALNLFILDIPRLSVDIDLNYVGTETREGMVEDRPKLEQALQAVFHREGYDVRRMPEEHAGGKWALRYASASGQGGNLEVDVNFMFRIPLWPVQQMDSRPLGGWEATAIPLLDIHEIAAGKLAAMFARRQARDLFDCHQILRPQHMDPQRLRTSFVIYGAANRKDWRTITIDDVNVDPEDFARQLIPTLRSSFSNRQESATEYGQRIVDELRPMLSILLPFTDSEVEFLNQLLENGEIVPDLLTDNSRLQDCIRRMPMLLWKAENVRQYRGLS